MSKLTSEEFLALTKGGKKAKGRTKYNNKIIEYKGTKYHSKKERDYRIYLDRLISLGEVIKYEEQVRYDCEINRSYCFFYKLDFKVFYQNGDIEHVDVKGKITDVFMLKKKVIEKLHGIEIILK